MKPQWPQIHKSLFIFLFSTYSSAWPCRFAAGKNPWKLETLLSLFHLLHRGLCNVVRTCIGTTMLVLAVSCISHILKWKTRFDISATCSSDQHVKIWDRDPSTNTWKNSASWKSHSGSVWKVTWAHPEFGQIVATCSFDRTAVIWEEVRQFKAKINQSKRKIK